MLAHGAGAPMDGPFMNAFAAGLTAAGFRVARFEFPYMQILRATGTRRPPDRLLLKLGDV
ncbi:MAG: alpha/beta family hydrolase [Kiloniellaceae bacterium]